MSNTQTDSSPVHLMETAGSSSHTTLSGHVTMKDGGRGKVDVESEPRRAGGRGFHPGGTEEDTDKKEKMKKKQHVTVLSLRPGTSPHAHIYIKKKRSSEFKWIHII